MKQSFFFLLLFLSFTPDSLMWTGVFVSRGRTYYVAGKYPEAISCFANAVHLFEKSQLRSHPNLLYAPEYLAKSFRNLLNSFV